MCAINPKHHFRVTLDFYTSQPLPEADFVENILHKILAAEQLINADGSIRCHASNPTKVAS